MPVEEELTEIDIEKFVLSALVHNAFLFSSLKDTIKLEYFSDIQLRKIYDLLIVSYGKFKKLISFPEACLELQGYVKNGDEERLKLKSVLIEVYWTRNPAGFNTAYNKSYISSKIEAFIKEKIVQSIVSEDIALKIKSNEDINYHKVYSKLLSLNSINLISHSTPFKLSEVEKVWDENPIDSNRIIKSGFYSLNKSLNYKGYAPKTINVFTGQPGSGKSCILISEGKNAILEGKNVVHIVLGDLSSWDVFTRYVPSLLNTNKYTTNIIGNMSKEEIKKVVQDNNIDGRFDRLVIETFPAYSIHADALYDEVIKIANDYYQNKVDMVIVDYADNLILDKDVGMYEGRGIQYQKLEKLAWDGDCVVFSASQPKGAYWDLEYITDSNINSESSKKNHVLDLDLAMGKPLPLPQEGYAIGTLWISKSRRGASGKSIHVRYDYTRSIVEEISYDAYLDLRKLAPQPQGKTSQFNQMQGGGRKRREDG